MDIIIFGLLVKIFMGGLAFAWLSFLVKRFNKSINIDIKYLFSKQNKVWGPEDAAQAQFLCVVFGGLCYIIGNIVS